MERTKTSPPSSRTKTSPCSKGDMVPASIFKYGSAIRVHEPVAGYLLVISY